MSIIKILKKVTKFHNSLAIISKDIKPNFAALIFPLLYQTELYRITFAHLVFPLESV